MLNTAPGYRNTIILIIVFSGTLRRDGSLLLKGFQPSSPEDNFLPPQFQCDLYDQGCKAHIKSCSVDLWKIPPPLPNFPQVHRKHKLMDISSSTELSNRYDLEMFSFMSVCGKFEHMLFFQTPIQLLQGPDYYFTGLLGHGLGPPNFLGHLKNYASSSDADGKVNMLLYMLQSLYDKILKIRWKFNFCNN